MLKSIKLKQILPKYNPKKYLGQPFKKLTSELVKTLTKPTLQLDLKNCKTRLTFLNTAYYLAVQPLLIKKWIAVPVCRRE